jgi:hypothetical protein
MSSRRPGTPHSVAFGQRCRVVRSERPGTISTASTRCNRIKRQVSSSGSTSGMTASIWTTEHRSAVAFTLPILSNSYASPGGRSLPQQYSMNGTLSGGCSQEWRLTSRCQFGTFFGVRPRNGILCSLRRPFCAPGRLPAAGLSKTIYRRRAGLSVQLNRRANRFSPTISAAPPPPHSFAPETE